MKISEFKQWLESRGVEIKKGADPWKLYYHGHHSLLPRHPSKELKEGNRNAILKQSNIRSEEGPIAPTL